MNVPRFFAFNVWDWGLFCTLFPEKRVEVPIPGFKETVTKYSGDAEGHIGESGRAWFDIIFGTEGYMVVSERVRDAVAKANVTGVAFHRVEITRIASKSLARKPRPNYFWLEPTGGICVDEDAYGLTAVPRDANGLRSISEWEIGRAIPFPGTWSGSDISRIENPRGGGRMCTIKVVELAFRERWTNACFVPMDLSSEARRTGFRLDNRVGRWPPKQWWPAGFEPDPRNIEERDF